MDLSNHLALWFSVLSRHQGNQLSPRSCPQTLSQTYWVSGGGEGWSTINFKSLGWSWCMLRFKNQQSSLIILPFLGPRPKNLRSWWKQFCFQLWMFWTMKTQFKDWSCPAPYFTIKQSKYQELSDLLIVKQIINDKMVPPSSSQPIPSSFLYSSAYTAAKAKCGSKDTQLKPQEFLIWLKNLSCPYQMGLLLQRRQG